MRTTIDKAGRIVVPAALRQRLGLVPGEVEIIADGAGLRIEPAAEGRVAENAGRLVIQSDDASELTADDIRELRLADQR